MRIIAGTHRSRNILGPLQRGSDAVTRPITDRVKQSLFDRLWSLGALEAPQALDLFSGTGSLGLEALSRGIPRCTFVERDRSACDRLQQNLEDLNLATRAKVIRVDVLSAAWLPAWSSARNILQTQQPTNPSVELPREAPGTLSAELPEVPGAIPGVPGLPGLPGGVVFCDPPYRIGQDKDGMHRLTALMERFGRTAAPDCVWVLRTSSDVAAPSAHGWLGPDSHRYGSMTLHFYRSTASEISSENPTGGDLPPQLP